MNGRSSTGAEPNPRVAARYDQLSHAFEDAGGYSYKSRMQGTLNGLGFTAEQYDQPAATYGAYSDAPAGYAGDAGWSAETSVPAGYPDQPAGYPDQGEPTRRAIQSTCRRPIHPGGVHWKLRTAAVWER